MLLERASRKRLLLSGAAIAYVLSVALPRHHGPPLRPLVAALGAVVLAYLFARLRTATLRTSALGCALLSGASAADAPILDLFAVAGSGLATFGGQRAVFEATAPYALSPKSRPPRAIAALLQALAWLTALGLTVAHIWKGPLSFISPRPLELLVAALSATLLVASLGRNMYLRRLEMVISVRMTAMLVELSTVGLFAVALTWADALHPERASRVAVGVSSILLGVTASYPNPRKLSVFTRRFTVLGFYTACILLVGSILSMLRPDATIQIGVGMSLLTLVTGASLERLEANLRPYGGLWLDCIEKGKAEVLDENSEQAVTRCLFALRTAAGNLGGSPELYTRTSGLVLTVDGAGYTRERRAEIPSEILAIASEQPEGTLRAEVLDALIVRRPDLRPLARWMDERGAVTATVLYRDGEVEGLLLMPRGDRSIPLTLEEACALSELAHKLVVPMIARGQKQVALEREQTLLARSERLEERIVRLEQALFVRRRRDELSALRIAAERPIIAYTAESRMALDTLFLRERALAPTVIAAPVGMDVLPWIAMVHSKGARASEPLVVVDAVGPEGQSVEAWLSEKSSPLVLANQGTLVVRDLGALAPAVQALLATALSTRVGPWQGATPIAFWFVALTHDSTAVPWLKHRPLEDYLSPTVAAWLTIPSYAARPEDLRALCMDRVTRWSLRLRGSPMGVSPDALRLLLEGSAIRTDLDLDWLCLELAQVSTGDCVQAHDVEELLGRSFSGPRDWRRTAAEARP